MHLFHLTLSTSQLLPVYMSQKSLRSLQLKQNAASFS